MEPQKQNNVRTLEPAASRLLTDATNRRILELLAADGRLSFTELARQVHLSTPALIARVRRLEHAGVIRGYGANLDLEALGLPITIFVFLTSTRTMEQQLRRTSSSSRRSPRATRQRRHLLHPSRLG